MGSDIYLINSSQSLEFQNFFAKSSNSCLEHFLISYCAKSTDPTRDSTRDFTRNFTRLLLITLRARRVYLTAWTEKAKYFHEINLQ